ncbi:MAG: 4-alpha-glucanotransferase, partial [Gammaproteobacteria bacterium]|nr:4-alpha-glucanotransferase [Gammaproteobacteria bacterium]
WLHEYALYAAIKNNFENKSWVDWPKELRNRNDSALAIAREEYFTEIEYVKFVQFIFHQQWMALKQYANSKEIKVFGDLPLFVSHDSADVWADKQLFKLDGEGQLLFVAGVPPDYFSETGQRWGNPVYDWVSHEADSFNWWIKRLENQFELFDYVRIDHFRGLESYWEIPAEHETALQGYWVTAPGKKMLSAVEKHFGLHSGKKLPLIAEDLGVITDDVVALKEDFQLPGMKILQFAFGGDSSNPYLPHNHEIDSVVYTGTHDNNTTLGWFNELSDEDKSHVYRYYESNESMPWLLMRSAYASVANIVVLPMQDLMGLDVKGRMNVPGTAEGNWLWRFEWKDLDKPAVIKYMNILNGLYGR